MKQPKRTTRNQRELLANHGYDWKKYGYVRESGFFHVFQNKETKELITIFK